MSKKSAVKPRAVPEVALQRVALGLYHAEQQYKGAKIPALEPRRKTVIHDVWHGKKLSARHQRVWNLTERLFASAMGSSVGNGGYGDPKGGGGGDSIVLRGGVNWAQSRVEYLQHHHLHTHEWRLLMALMRDQWQVGEHGERLLHLDQIGQTLDGYRDAAQSRAAGVADIHRLLDSLAEFHGE